MLPLAAQPLTITTPQATLPVAVVGQIYTDGPTSTNPLFAFTATGGTPPYNWSSSGSPPYGTLSVASDGYLTGQPQGCQHFWVDNNKPQCADPFEPMTGTFQVTVVDSTAPTPLTQTQTYTLSVDWNPSESTYLTNQLTNFAAMATSAGHTLPPPMPAGGRLVIANPLFRNIAYDNQAAWNAWVDAMKAKA